jgi:hypothetical protein
MYSKNPFSATDLTSNYSFAISPASYPPPKLPPRQFNLLAILHAGSTSRF